MNLPKNEERVQFSRELRLVPWWAVLLAGAFFIGVFLLMHLWAWPHERNPPPVGVQVLISFMAGSLLAFLMLMIGYVNRDAKRRGMNALLWTLVVILVGNGIGFIIYFLVRRPLMVRCPQCAATVSPRFNYCPNCKHNFHPTCPQCKAAIRPGDTFCPYCGTTVTSDK